jgi:hypothetical protein
MDGLHGWMLLPRDPTEYLAFRVLFAIDAVPVPIPFLHSLGMLALGADPIRVIVQVVSVVPRGREEFQATGAPVTSAPIPMRVLIAADAKVSIIWGLCGHGGLQNVVVLEAVARCSRHTICNRCQYADRIVSDTDKNRMNK